MSRRVTPFAVLLLVLVMCRFVAAETVVNFATWGSAQEQQLWERDIADFERQNPDVKVNLILSDWNTYIERLPLVISGTIEADVVRIGGQHLPTFAHRGILLPLDPYVARGQIKRQEFLTPVLESATYGGLLYGLPDHFSPWILYYNAELFKQYGLIDPVTLYRQGQWTWEEFETIGHKLRIDRSGAGIPTQWGIPTSFTPTNPYTRQAMKLANGGRVYNPELTRYYLDEVPNIEALQWLADLRELTGSGWEAGNLGMTNGWPSVQLYWASTIGFEFGAAPMPRPRTGTHATIMTTNILSVLQTAENPDAAVRYINHICGTEVQRRRIDDNYVVSGRIDVAAESLRERRMAAINNDVIMDITAHTKAWAVPIGYYDEVPNLVNRELAALARGDEPTFNAAKRIAQMVNAILSGK
ncbi:MAG: sugar ABC transporter substrate-binding protein [Firmicutes bacterium]|nr:sugar ABC transporter substrate-binding protein [Bacillota bacterium]